MDDFTLADLVQVTGAKRRSVQLWAEGGALIADVDTERAGTGVHRKFSRQEAIIACVLSVLSRMRISIGTLRTFSQVTRGIMADDDAARSEFEDCIQGRRTIYLFFSVPKREENFDCHYLILDGDEDADEKQRMLGSSLEMRESKYGAVVLSIKLDPHLAKLR